nr:MAG TPA: hypothetical protein [Bacteriophage sp.]
MLHLYFRCDILIVRVIYSLFKNYIAPFIISRAEDYK